MTWIDTRRAGGVLILLMVTGTIAGGLSGTALSGALLWTASACGWLAALLLIKQAPRALRVQVAVLIAAGVLLMALAGQGGAEPDLYGAVTGNLGLIAMVTAVGFLRVVALPPNETRAALPTGPRAYVHTLLSTSLLGAVINISAPILIADRIDEQRPLQRLTAQSIIRVFTACAAWSPFFAGMAVVLTYVPGARLSWLIPAGLPFAAAALAVVYAEARLRFRSEVQSFVGYPLRPGTLWLPAVLATMVFLGRWALPELSILIVIAVSALLVTACTLWLRHGFYGGLARLGDYVGEALPRTVNELVLFLAAGVLAAGIASIVDTGALPTPISAFEAGDAIGLLGLMIVTSAAGVHPIIVIAGFTPLLAAVDPEPHLLALTYLFAWSLGTCAGPLSGTLLVFQGRYGIPSWKAAAWNWPYVAFMYVLASAWIWFVAGR